MEGYRFEFMKGKKENCPSCEGKRTYRRYFDKATGEILPYEYGRCDRENNCGYFLNPYTDKYHLKGNDYSFNYNYYQIKNIKKVEYKDYYIPNYILEATKTEYDNNKFIQNLLNNISYPFNYDEVYKLIDMYQLGTITEGYMRGAITFPYIDINQNVNAIQCKTFDFANHSIYTNYIHSILEKKHVKDKKPIPKWIDDYELNEGKVKCLFGEHLLEKYPHNPIALVEAPKTALIGTIYFGFPDNPKNYLWLAVYNKSSLNYSKCKQLKNRKVVLFPDTSKNGATFSEWKEKAEKIQEMIPNSTFEVSDLLEQLATESQKQKGIDIADILTNYDWKTFRNLN
ncbi:DUF6371 domain-containing protein [Empedobacter brevis]